MTITNIISPLPQYHHYHNFTTITITIITVITITITTITTTTTEEISQQRDLTAQKKKVSHESFVFTSSTFTFWRTSRRKASVSHLQFSLLQGCLARKLRFHIFHFQILREVSQESFGFTSSIFTFGGTSRTKVSVSHLPLSDFEGFLTLKLRFHILKSRTRGIFESSRMHEMLCFAGQSVPRKMDGEASPAGGCGTRSFEPGSWSDQPCSGTASSGFIFTTWTFKIWKMSRTKASFSHLPLSDFEGSLAGKLRFHIFHFHVWKDVSHESFGFTSSTFRFWGISRRKASVPHLPFSLLEGRLARKLRFHIFHFQILRDFSHESCVFTPSTFTIWGKSRTRGILES